MKSIKTGKKTDLVNYLMLAIFLLAAYLPVSSLQFALKNDALTDNFPNKYFFSAALHAGHLPLWNPYINFGLPLYADPGFAFWQPITWIFGFVGYNVYILSAEILVYIWIGGIGMFELGKYFHHNRMVCFCMAIMYMCCGFFVGNLQHINFLTCAAFLPWLTMTFLQIQEKFSFRWLLYCVLCIYLMATGGHPAIPFASVYFLGILLIGIYFFKRNENATGNKARWVRSAVIVNSVLILTTCALLAPLLYSYTEILPYLTRAQPVLQKQSLDVGFTIPSYLSFLFPFSTTASATLFGNDELMRNGYFSFLGFLLFISSIFHKKNKYQVIFLIAGAFMLVLSLGGMVKAILYPHLPLLKYIRTNGEFRVFALFSFIVVSSFSLTQMIKNEGLFFFNRLMKILALVCVATILVVSLTTVHVPNPNSLQNSETESIIKWWLDHWTFHDRLLLNCIILLLLTGVYFLLKKKMGTGLLFTTVLVLDLIIFCWMQLPVTGVQRRSVASIQQYFNGIPTGIPIPKLEPIQSNIRPGEDLSKIIGYWSYYSKQPGTPERGDYPTLLKSTEDYFESGLSNSISRHPFLFFQPDSNKHQTLTLLKYTPTEIIIRANNNNLDTLILLQNYFPGWGVTVNNQEQMLFRKYISFIGIPLKEKSNNIRFHFKDQTLFIYLIVAIASFLLLILAAIWEKVTYKVRSV